MCVCVCVRVCVCVCVYVHVSCSLPPTGWLYHTVPAVSNPSADAHNKAIELLKLAVGADPSSGRTWYFLGRWGHWWCVTIQSIPTPPSPLFPPSLQVPCGPGACPRGVHGVPAGCQQTGGGPGQRLVLHRVSLRSSSSYPLSLLPCLPPSLTHSLLPSLPHFLPLFPSLSLPYSLTPSFPLSLLHSLTPSLPSLSLSPLSPSLTHSLPHSLSPSFTHSLPHSLSPSSLPPCSVLYHNMSQPRDSLQSYLCAVYLDPTQPSAWVDMGCLYESIAQPV